MIEHVGERGLSLAIYLFAQTTHRTDAFWC